MLGWTLWFDCTRFAVECGRSFFRSGRLWELWGPWETWEAQNRVLEGRRGPVRSRVSVQRRRAGCVVMAVVILVAD